MNVLKKYTWLVGTLMRAGDKGLTLEQIGDRWNATEELHEEGAFARRSFHRHRSEIMDLFGIGIECYMDGGQYRYRLADDGGREYFPSPTAARRRNMSWWNPPTAGCCLCCWKH